MPPTIEMWETSLQIRDNVFLQIALLTVALYLGYRLLRGIFRTIVLIGGLALFAVLLYVSVANILQWSTI